MTDGKPGGSAPEAMMCSGPIFLPQLLELEIVEIVEIACGDADGADAKAGFQVVDAVEIDQPLQRLAAAARCRNSFAIAGCPAATTAPAESAA